MKDLHWPKLRANNLKQTSCRPWKYSSSIPPGWNRRHHVVAFIVGCVPVFENIITYVLSKHITGLNVINLCLLCPSNIFYLYKVKLEIFPSTLRFYVLYHITDRKVLRLFQFGFSFVPIRSLLSFLLFP